MTTLSAALACVGLLQGSTAVVVDAMLVSPMVGPLVGTELALVRGNIHPMRVSFQVALAGIALSFLISIFFGLISPGYEPTPEGEAHGRPDPFDLFVALASAMVAAYSQDRRCTSCACASCRKP
jgi:uncharacterized membrane protein